MTVPGCHVAMPCLSLALLAALACSGPEVEEGTDEYEAVKRSTLTRPVFDAPKKGKSLPGPWMPLLVRLPEGFEDARTEASLDGEPLTLASPVIRRRMDKKGGGLDLIATLDLDGLDAGAHELTIGFELPSAPRSEATRSFVYEPPPGRVELSVTDGQQPVSARVLVLDAEGKMVRSYPRASHPADQAKRCRHFSSHFAIDGQAAFHLEPGRYTFVATRGLLHHVDVQEVQLSAGTTRLAFVIPPAVEAAGTIVADLHVHTARSPDAFVPDLLRFRSFETAGLDLVVITDHNKVSDLRPAQAAMPWSRVQLVSGVEARIGVEKGVGHLNVFPLEPGTPMPPWSDDVGRVYDQFLAIDPDALLQLNHPRGIQFRVRDETHSRTHALFTHRGYKRRRAPGQGPNAWMTQVQPVTGTTPLDIHAFELMNRFSYDVWLRVRGDWFALMNHGYFPVATGNSDSHSLAVEAVGFPVNLVRVGAVPRDELQAAFLGAVARGRVSVSTGPVVDLRVEAGAASGQPGDMVAGSDAVAHVSVQAAPWVPVPEIRLVMDGRVIQRVELAGCDLEADGSLRYEASWPLPAADSDSWVVAEAGWPLGAKPRFPPEVSGLYAKLAPGAAPVGFTNAVRLDRDGDGQFSSSKQVAQLPEGGCNGT